MIYLFTNVEFGKSFLEVVRRRRDAAAWPSVTVVLSAKRPWPTRRVARIKQRLVWSIQSWQRARRLAREVGVDVLTSQDVNRSLLRRVAPGDHAFVAGFNQIFKPALIERFRSVVNCHPSLLPFYRGPVPTFWCLENGERRTGFTFHRLTAEIDKGEMLWQEAIDIAEGDTPAALNARIGARAAPVFEQYLLSLTGAARFEPQTVDAATVYAHHVDYRSFPRD